MLKVIRTRNRAPTKFTFPGILGTSRYAHGLSLIEILVALLVLSIGLAGMAALHLNSLKNVSSSYYRSLASTIALDYEERLWLNASRAPEADLDADLCPNLQDVADELVADWTSTGPTITDGSDNGWTSGERATLPSLDVEPGDSDKTVASTATGSTTPTTWIEVPITVSWTDNRFQGEPDEAFVYTVRTLCRQPSPSS